MKFYIPDTRCNTEHRTQYDISTFVHIQCGIFVIIWADEE